MRGDEILASVRIENMYIIYYFTNEKKKIKSLYKPLCVCVCMFLKNKDILLRSRFRNKL